MLPKLKSSQHGQASTEPTWVPTDKSLLDTLQGGGGLTEREGPMEGDLPKDPSKAGVHSVNLGVTL